MRLRHAIRFRASDLEAGRMYLWRREYLPLLYKYLELHPNQTVVDVGSGTGSFTRLLAKGIKYEGKVTGIERNRRLLNVARELSVKQKLPPGVVKYKLGKAEALPLQDNSADRVVCQMVLWLLRNREKALQEMIRVCKPGGLIGAIDCVVENVAFYYPHNERLTELSKKVQSALVKGYARAFGADRNIGHKLPTMFVEQGLERIRLDAYGYVWSDGDGRIPLDVRQQAHKKYVDEFDSDLAKKIRKENEEILLLGGMKQMEINEYREKVLQYSMNVKDNPKMLERDSSTNSGIFYITTGLKPLALSASPARGKTQS